MDNDDVKDPLLGDEEVADDAELEDGLDEEGLGFEDEDE